MKYRRGMETFSIENEQVFGTPGLSNSATWFSSFRVVWSVTETIKGDLETQADERARKRKREWEWELDINHEMNILSLNKWMDSMNEPETMT